VGTGMVGESRGRSHAAFTPGGELRGLGTHALHDRCQGATAFGSCDRDTYGYSQQGTCWCWRRYRGSSIKGLLKIKEEAKRNSVFLVIVQ